MDYLLSGGRADSAAPIGVHLFERTPWDASSPAINTYRSQAQFEALKNGLTPHARKQLLEDGLS